MGKGITIAQNNGYCKMVENRFRQSLFFRVEGFAFDRVGSLGICAVVLSL